jgi:hypothetical protein
MTEEGVKVRDEQYLGTFVQSYSKLYEQWKRKSLLLVALQTFPKQVKKENVGDNLLKLRAEFDKRLSDEG